VSQRDSPGTLCRFGAKSHQPRGRGRGHGPAHRAPGPLAGLRAERGSPTCAHHLPSCRGPTEPPPRHPRLDVLNRRAPVPNAAKSPGTYLQRPPCHSLHPSFSALCPTRVGLLALITPRHAVQAVAAGWPGGDGALRPGRSGGSDRALGVADPRLCRRRQPAAPSGRHELALPAPATELLCTPVAATAVAADQAIVDVGFDRRGQPVAGGPDSSLAPCSSSGRPSAAGRTLFAAGPRRSAGAAFVPSPGGCTGGLRLALERPRAGVAAPTTMARSASSTTRVTLAQHGLLDRAAPPAPTCRGARVRHGARGQEAGRGARPRAPARGDLRSADSRAHRASTTPEATYPRAGDNLIPLLVQQGVSWMWCGPGPHREARRAPGQRATPLLESPRTDAAIPRRVPAVRVWARQTPAARATA
jgi:hypothetical protein